MILSMPHIIEENEDFAVVYKPPKMHTAKTAIGRRSCNAEQLMADKNSLAEWYLENVQNNNLHDCGLVHRLDFETHGLVLFAKNQKSFDFFKSLQDKGEFVKEYSAVCTASENLGAGFVTADGFPLAPVLNVHSMPAQEDSQETSGSIIMSYFRPYGPGRKQVRPVINIGKQQKEIARDKGGFYKTEIMAVKKHSAGGTVFTVCLRRGFRHQIRCHLRWIGFPILNDPLYGQLVINKRLCDMGQLMLRASALYFIDPANGEKKECKIEALG